MRLWVQVLLLGKKFMPSSSTGNASDTTSSFSAASDRSNIASGEKLSIMFGKIARWFSDLKALAFKDKVSKSDLDSGVQTMLAAGEVKMRKVTLTVAGWNSSTKQQTAAVSGVLADGTKQRVICSPVDESYDSIVECLLCAVCRPWGGFSDIPVRRDPDGSRGGFTCPSSRSALHREVSV